MRGESTFEYLNPRVILQGLGEFFNLRKNFYKVSPMTWFFFLAVIFVIAGLIFQYYLLIWVGLFIIGFYLLYFVLYVLITIMKEGGV